jgi:two-component system CheB/CheR fusion protein
MSETDATASEHAQVQQLVVVGASAGGVDALSTLVAGLPADFPAPIVIAQHLDPARASRLGEILAARTALPVRTVVAKEPLAAGVVYVVPSGHDVEVTDHTVGLLTEGAVAPMPSVDHLLLTASRVFTDNLVAVVLSGSGADGAIGAQSVKALGGTVVVQNPATARFSGMPGSVAPSAVDIVADLEEIGPLLVELVRGPRSPLRDGKDADLPAFLDLIRDRSGLDFSSYKRATIERRLDRRMAAVGLPALAAYRHYAERHPAELQRLIGSFLIKVTEFFRDPDLFAYLREQVLPPLVDEARERGELRLWSAGCATGEEAYSLAMIVADLLGDDHDALAVRIFATDIAADAVDFARRGVYPSAALQEVPSDLVERHFLPRDGSFELNKRIRGLVVFGDHDLGSRPPFPRIDLVLCRNVLIYFTADLQRRVLQRFAFSLRRGGCLVLGKAETISPLPEFFAPEQPRLKVFRRIGDPAPVPPDDQPWPGRTSPLAARPGRQVPSVRHLAPAATQSIREPVLGVAVRRLLEGLPVGIATVDRGYRVRTINGAARGLLGITAEAMGEDLVHGVAASLAPPVRAVLDAALAGESETVRHHVPADALVEESRDLWLIGYPSFADLHGDEPEAVVVVVDVTETAGRLRDLAAERDDLQVRLDRETARAAQAITTVRSLQRANQELVSANTRLQIENEELLVSHEEVQAAAEEIETLNEELQATNEELETLNEEQQATVEELTTTNDELEARGTELQSLATSLDLQRQAVESERARLDAILAAMGDAVLVVDADGAPVLSNPAFDRLFGRLDALRPADTNGRLLPEAAWPQRRAAAGETFSLEFTLSAADGGRRWFEASGRPIAGEEGTRLGVVVIRDITDRSLRRLQEQFVAMAGHELRTPLTSLSGMVQLIARDLARAEADERLQRYAVRAREQVDRLESQIDELMDVARLEHGTFRIAQDPVDLAALAARVVDTVEPMAGGREIRVTLEPGSAPLVVGGDRRRLEQVLLNLLNNAIAHAPDTERIDIDLRRDGAEAAVAVRDFGPGIPPEALPAIFSRFYQADGPARRQHGLGLGLFIAREIVDAHGGTLDASSVFGEGATFTLRLPLRDEEPAVPEPDAIGANR